MNLLYYLRHDKFLIKKYQPSILSLYEFVIVKLLEPTDKTEQVIFLLLSVYRGV